jgi:hypothetical protein
MPDIKLIEITSNNVGRAIPKQMEVDVLSVGGVAILAEIKRGGSNTYASLIMRNDKPFGVLVLDADINTDYNTTNSEHCETMENVVFYLDEKTIAPSNVLSNEGLINATSQWLHKLFLQNAVSTAPQLGYSGDTVWFNARVQVHHNGQELLASAFDKIDHGSLHTTMTALGYAS